MIHEIHVSTSNHSEMVDISDQVKEIVSKSQITSGLCNIFVPHATGAITINENADPNVPDDILTVLDKIVPRGAGYRHDRIDGNAHSHIKASIVGSSQTIPIIDGKLALGTWQDIFFCDFDGPRTRRKVIVTLMKAD